MHRFGEQQSAQFLAQQGAAGLARLHDMMSALAQKIDQPRKMRAFPGPIDAFQRDELAWRGHFFLS
jgi:hypothetical protein